ncbi:aspartate racemase [Spirochaetia bacterium]|nr:aspartate racemase [Spirochaetia bacterium]
MKPVIGVIGGVGPYAGLDFVRNIFDNTRAVTDQEHLNTVLISCPSLIPDRTDFLLNKHDEKDNPAYGMFACAKMLYDAGARFVTVACNTAHAAPIFGPYSAMVAEKLPGLTIVNMLETCASYVREALGFTRIGLLATRGTHVSGVYREYFKAAEGITLLEPDNEEQEAVHDLIYNKEYGIKAHSSPVSPRAKETLSKAILTLAGRGAEAVVLGCTELPLAVEKKADFPLPLLNPALIAARRLITLADPGKLAG